MKYAELQLKNCNKMPGLQLKNHNEMGWVSNEKSQ